MSSSPMTTFVTVDMTAETSALDTGDVIADTQVVANACRAADIPATLVSLQVIDVDDQGALVNVVLLSSNVSLGTEDAAPDIDDTEAQSFMGLVAIAAADWVDLGGAKVVSKNNLNIVCKPAAGTRDIYMALYTPATSTPTYAGGHIYVRLGFRSH